MITKTAKRILLALCTALAAVCLLFAIGFKPTLAKASTSDSDFTEATLNKVTPTKGVTDEGVTVEYLEFDGLSGDTWFMVEFTGKNAPNFAVNATEAYSVWNDEAYTTAGIFMRLSGERSSGELKINNSLNTGTGEGTWKTVAGSATIPIGLNNYDDNTKYIMILGFDKDGGANDSDNFYYYLYSVNATTLTKVTGGLIVENLALTNAGGSKAVIYPNITSGADTITFNYVAPQQSLSELVCSLNENNAYRAQLVGMLKKEPVYNYSTQTLTTKGAKSDNTIGNGETVESIAFSGFGGPTTWMLVDFVGQNAPNFAFNATNVYSQASIGNSSDTAGNTLIQEWGALRFGLGFKKDWSKRFTTGEVGYGQAYFDKSTNYVMIAGSERTDTEVTISLYLFTVDASGSVTAARDVVKSTSSKTPMKATGDKAVIYSHISSGKSSVTFNFVNPATSLSGVIANIPSTCAYKQSLMNVLGIETMSYSVTLQNENGEEVATESVIEGETYTLPTSNIANFVAWKIGGKLYKPGTEIAVTEDLTVKAVCLDFTMEEGASIRIASTAQYHGGLRFVVKVNTAQLSALGATVYGFVLPTDSISGEFDKTDATNATVLENSVTDGNYTVYYITLTNVLYSNYNREFSAMAYIDITLADDTTLTVQTSYDEEKNSRSIYEVAVRAYNDTEEYSKYSEQEKKVLASYINSTVNLVKVDDETYEVASVEDGLPVTYERGYAVVTSYDDANERLVCTITMTIESKLISTSDNLPHVPVTVWVSDGNGGYTAQRMAVVVQSYVDGVVTLFFR